MENTECDEQVLPSQSFQTDNKKYSHNTERKKKPEFFRRTNESIKAFAIRLKEVENQLIAEQAKRQQLERQFAELQCVLGMMAQHLPCQQYPHYYQQTFTAPVANQIMPPQPHYGQPFGQPIHPNQEFQNHYMHAYAALCQQMQQLNNN